MYRFSSCFTDKSYHKKYNKEYTGITFNTLSLPCLNYYFYLFYKNGTFHPELLTPVSLADDGFSN